MKEKMAKTHNQRFSFCLSSKKQEVGMVEAIWAAMNKKKIWDFELNN